MNIPTRRELDEKKDWQGWKKRVNKR